jgi:hypothetical protein
MVNTIKSVKIDEVASEARLLLPECMSSFSKYAVGMILGRLDDKIQFYIDDETGAEMDAEEWAGYFDLGEIFEMLQQGVDEAVDATVALFEADRAGFSFSEGSVVSSFRKVCIVSMRPYLESVSSVKDAAVDYIADLRAIQTQDVDYIDDSGESIEREDVTPCPLDITIMKSFEEYDLLVESLENALNKLFIKYFLEDIQYSVDTGDIDNLTEFVVDMKGMMEIL